MGSASEVAGFLALLGGGIAVGYFGWRYWDEISEEIEKLKSEKRRLRKKVGELDHTDSDAVLDEIETSDWRS